MIRQSSPSRRDGPCICKKTEKRQSCFEPVFKSKWSTEIRTVCKLDCSPSNICNVENESQRTMKYLDLCS